MTWQPESTWIGDMEATGSPDLADSTSCAVYYFFFRDSIIIIKCFYVIFPVIFIFLSYLGMIYFFLFSPNIKLYK